MSKRIIYNSVLAGLAAVTGTVVADGTGGLASWGAVEHTVAGAVAAGIIATLAALNHALSGHTNGQ